MTTQPKTPFQHATLQFAEHSIINALVIALAAIAPLIAGSGLVNWRQDVTLIVLLFSASLLHSWLAYIKASNAPLASVLAADVSVIEKQLPAPATSSEDTQQIPKIPKSAPLQGSTGTTEGQSI